MTIHEILHKQYPSAIIKIPDKNYHKATHNELWNELISSYFEDYKYIKETLDCDDYALLLHAWIRQQQYKNHWKKPLAFGEAWSTKHAVNIAVLENSKIVLIEPQTDALLPADAYDIVFIRM